MHAPIENVSCHGQRPCKSREATSLPRIVGVGTIATEPPPEHPKKATARRDFHQRVSATQKLLRAACANDGKVRCRSLSSSALRASISPVWARARSTRRRLVVMRFIRPAACLSGYAGTKESEVRRFRLAVPSCISLSCIFQIRHCVNKTLIILQT